MKRIFLILLLCTVAAMAGKAQLLYKISGNGLTKPSYILGTYHLASASFADSIKGIREAKANTIQVYGELIMSDLMTQGNMQKMQNAMLLPDGKTLQGVLTKEQMQRLNVFMKKYIGADMSNPMVASQMGKMSPQALLTTFTVLMYMKSHPGKVDPAKFIDNYFQQEALSKGKIVGGFESMDYQIKVLFQGTSMERQVEQLMCLVDNEKFFGEITEKITNAYYAQDMKALQAAVDEKIGNSCDSTPEEDAQLVSDRNQNWVKLMPDVMKSAPTLFVVGAAHLPGDKGVLALLTQAGYRVDALR